MKKRVKSILLCTAALLGVGAFATACGEEETPHVHTYSEDWTADAEGHFHQATCDDAEDEAKEAHVDKNNDGACDICEYTDHTHTYSEDWTVDCTNHWHAADCGHIVAGSDVAEHVDENEDGKCDVCQYVIEDIHEHYYSNEWTGDESYHWHAALCEHKVEVSDKAAHNLNAAGDCTVCGAHINDVDATDIGAVLNAAVANNYKVNYGDVTANTEVWGGTGKETLENGATDKVHFALGNGQSYIQLTHFDMTGTFADQKEQWFETVGEEIFGVEMAYGEYELSPIDGAAQFLNGYNYIPGSVIASADTDTSTLANMISALYSQMKAGVHVSNAAEEVVDGVYRFMYTYYSLNVQTSGGAVFNTEVELYNVRAQFTVNEDMIIDWAEFEVEVYRDYGEGETADRDLSYTYNAETGDVDDLALKDTANPTYYRYSVSQTSGERTFTSPYPRESLLPTSFELYHVTDYDFPDSTTFVLKAEEEIGETLTVQEGDYVYFHIGDLMPQTASSKFINTEDFSFSFVNNDANSTARAWYMDAGSIDETLNTYSADISCLKLWMRDPGEYTVTIGFGDFTKTFVLTIEVEQAPEVGEDDENTINVATTDTYGYFDLYSYTASAEGTYTFTLPAGLGLYSKSAYDSWGAPEVDVCDPYVDKTVAHTVEVQLAKDEKFEFYVGAETKDSWVITVSFEAGEVGGGDVGGDTPSVEETELTIGNNSNEAADKVWGYTAETAGTLTLSYGGWVMGPGTATYSVNGGAATAIEAGVDAVVTLAQGDKVVITVVANGGYITLTAAWAGEGGEEGGEEDTSKYETVIVAGDNTLYFSEAEITAGSATRTVSITEAGTYSFNSSFFVSNVTKVGGDAVTQNDDYSYTLEVGEYTITCGMFELMDITADQECSLTLSTVGSEEETADPIYLSTTDNTISVTDTDIENGSISATFFAMDAGNYKFTSNSLFVSSVTANGSEVTANSGVYTLEAYTEYTVVISTSYISGAGNYVLTIAYEAPLGSQENPIVITAADNTASWTGGYTPIWYAYTATEDGTLTVSTTDTTATLLISLVAGYEKESAAGVVTLNVMAGVTYNIGVMGGSSEAEIPFTVALTAGTYTADSTANAPKLITIGDNSIDVAQYDASYAAYKATAAGTLTLTTTATNCDWFITSPEYIAPVEGVITVEMEEGDMIIVYITTTDGAEVTIAYAAAWKAAPTAVTDVTIVTGDNALTIAENTYIEVGVYGFVGNYTATWNVDTVTVMVDGVIMENGGVFNSTDPRQAVTFKIYGANYAAVESLTLTITAYVAPATELALGENTVTVTDTYNGTNVKYTATAAATYTFTAGTNAVLGYDYSNYLAGEFFSVELAEGASVEFVVLTEDYSASDVVVTVSNDSEEEGGEVVTEPDGSQA